MRAARTRPQNYIKVARAGRVMPNRELFMILKSSTFETHFESLFENHDPNHQANGQGNEVGSQYRSTISRLRTLSLNKQKPPSAVYSELMVEPSQRKSPPGADLLPARIITSNIWRKTRKDIVRTAHRRDCPNPARVTFRQNNFWMNVAGLS